MISAVDYGIRHGSCDEAMTWRRSLPPDATQADAYAACERGDWLVWQLTRIPEPRYEVIRLALSRALDVIVQRALGATWTA